MMSQTYKKQKPRKELTTIEVQDLIYKRRLELHKLRNGMNMDELLQRANDPRRFAKSRKSKK